MLIRGKGKRRDRENGTNKRQEGGDGLSARTRKELAKRVECITDIYVQ